MGAAQIIYLRFVVPQTYIRICICVAKKLGQLGLKLWRKETTRANITPHPSLCQRRRLLSRSVVSIKIAFVFCETEREKEGGRGAG